MRRPGIKARKLLIYHRSTCKVKLSAVEVMSSLPSFQIATCMFAAVSLLCQHYKCSLPPVLLLYEPILVCVAHSTIQDNWTALKQASFLSHQKVVELLLQAGANPDLQDKVSTGETTYVHANLNSSPSSCETRSWSGTPSYTYAGLVPS